MSGNSERIVKQTVFNKKLFLLDYGIQIIFCPLCGFGVEWNIGVGTIQLTKLCDGCGVLYSYEVIYS